MRHIIRRVLITDPIDAQFVIALRGYGLEVVEKSLSKDQLLKEIPNYEALVVRSGTNVTADVIVAGSKLKLIGRAGTVKLQMIRIPCSEVGYPLRCGVEVPSCVRYP